jgi:two-component system, chemotaxis family, chemotaxis protein CheY
MDRSTPAAAHAMTIAGSLPAFFVLLDLMTATKTKTVLVVDDSATMRRMVIASLRGLGGGISFEQAESGLSAIERLSLRPVHLVVLDLNMPDVHGLEVLRFIRSHDAFGSVPVVVLTTRDDAAGRDAALGGGATLYLTKPFSPESLSLEIGRLLESA